MRIAKRTDRLGATVVEMAIVAPIFFLVLFASVELSRLSVMRSTADHAAYEAARICFVPGGTAAEATAAANQLMDIVGTRGAVVTITPSILTDETEEVTVDIAIPFDQNAFIVPRFLKSGVVNSTSTLRTERIITIGST